MADLSFEAVGEFSVILGDRRGLSTSTHGLDEIAEMIAGALHQEGERAEAETKSDETETDHTGEFASLIRARDAEHELLAETAVLHLMAVATLSPGRSRQDCRR